MCVCEIGEKRGFSFYTKSVITLQESWKQRSEERRGEEAEVVEDVVEVEEEDEVEV